MSQHLALDVRPVATPNNCGPYHLHAWLNGGRGGMSQHLALHAPVATPNDCAPRHEPQAAGTHASLVVVAAHRERAERTQAAQHLHRFRALRSGAGKGEGGGGTHSSLNSVAAAWWLFGVEEGAAAVCSRAGRREAPGSGGKRQAMCAQTGPAPAAGCGTPPYAACINPHLVYKVAHANERVVPLLESHFLQELLKLVMAAMHIPADENAACVCTV